MTLCKILVALAVFSGSVFAQSNADHSGFNDVQVNWKTDCAPRGCLMLTQVLRGDAGGAADPKDAREYVGLNVALARKTRQPEYIAFYVDPRATQGQGIFVAFAKARRDGVSWKMALDDDGAIRVPFTSCGKLGCMARIPAGTTNAGIYHTHETVPGYAPDQFSTADAMHAVNEHVPNYIETPAGLIHEIDGTHVTSYLIAPQYTWRVHGPIP